MSSMAHLLRKATSSKPSVAQRRPPVAFARSVVATAGLLAQRRLALPKRRVGEQLYFSDGSRTSVFRETVVRDAGCTDPAVLVVQFRLRLLGRRRLLHTLFRLESIANTPLFAGFPGFRSKLWCYDAETGMYRGVYEWDGAAHADAYARTLVRLLRWVSVGETLRYHVVARTGVAQFLEGRAAVVGAAAGASGGEWWRLIDRAGREGVRQQRLDRSAR